MAATIVPILTGMKHTNPGDGLCVFFWDPTYEFFPAGIGGALGYSNYHGPLAFNSDTLGGGAFGLSASEVNGIQGAYVGVGFDIRGNFSNTEEGKTGRVVLGTETDTVTSQRITSLQPNTVCVRTGAVSSYQINSVSPNLNSYPIVRELSAANTYDQKYADSPPLSLHQNVASRDDVEFRSIKVTLQNDGKVVKVEIKNPVDNKYYPYHIATLEGKTLGEALTYATKMPTTLRVGIAFSTSDAVTNCEIKNFSVYGAAKNYGKRFIVPPEARSFKPLAT